MSFRFVSPAEQLTPEYERDITAAEAWVRLTFTGANKPDGDLGAIVNERFQDSLIQMNQLKKELNEEKRKREEADLILANHIADMQNLLAENDILRKNNEIVRDAHSTLFYCQVCFERQRNTMLHPCGHVVICSECANNILNSPNKRCPVCRATIIETQRALVI
jgi:rubrerythrin